MARRAPRPDDQPTLLEAAARRGGPSSGVPLAERLRPKTVEEMAGQAHLLAEGRMLARAIAEDVVPSMILWGPPGSGKTTLARVIAERTQRVFAPFSAVLGGVAELREIIDAAKERRRYAARGTLLFVDEIHRFNKAQQDAFLPHVEDGTVTLIGATTENPSFSVNAAVLSRCKVFRLEALDKADLVTLLSRALKDPRSGFVEKGVSAEPEALSAIAQAARGDARRALGMLETAVELLAPGETLTRATVTCAADDPTLLHDRAGEEHYNVSSAFIKSLRGSDPDAAIYWMMRLLDAGDDPLFVLRRMLIFASEDVGNADPRALGVAVDADAAFRRMGLPEGLYPMAQACLYLATCPKSNSAGKAFSAARQAIREHGALPVPMKLRNAVTGLMKNEGYGAGYRYAHDHGGYVAGETYLPDALIGARYYEPVQSGFETQIFERLERLRASVTQVAQTQANPLNAEQKKP